MGSWATLSPYRYTTLHYLAQVARAGMGVAFPLLGLGLAAFPFLLFSKPNTFPLFARFQLVFSEVSLQNSSLSVIK